MVAKQSTKLIHCTSSFSHNCGVFSLMSSHSCLCCGLINKNTVITNHRESREKKYSEFPPTCQLYTWSNLGWQSSKTCKKLPLTV